MIDPVEMAARYASAARVCGEPVPCGWCLWRAGYRKGRRPRLPRIPRGVVGGPDLFTQPDPAVPGNTGDYTMTDTTLWHVRFDGCDPITSGAASKRRAIEEAATVLDLPSGGVRRCRVWRTVDGLPTGAAQTVDVVITRTVSIEFVRGTAASASQDAGNGSTGDDE